MSLQHFEPDEPPPPPPPKRPRQSAPALRAFLAAGLAWAVMAALSRLFLAPAGLFVPTWLGVLGQGALAALFSYMLGLAVWWLPINFLLPPMVWLALLLPVPPILYLVIFFVLLLIYWNAADDRVPLYLTNRQTWAALETFLPEEQSFSFIDLGCGLGGPLLHLSRRCPNGLFVGIESAPLPFAIAWIRARLTLRRNLTIRYGNLWDVHLGLYDVAYGFLSPHPMEQLLRKAETEMRPGALLISNSFRPDAPEPTREVLVDDSRESELFVWEF